MIVFFCVMLLCNQCRISLPSNGTCICSLVSVVAQWLAHLPLVLEAPGSITPRGEENFSVQTSFL